MNDDDKRPDMDDPAYWDWVRRKAERDHEARVRRGKLEPSYAVGEKVRFAGYEGYVRSVDTTGLLPAYEVVGLMRNSREVAGLVDLVEEDPQRLVPAGGHDIVDLIERIDGSDPYISSL